MRVDLLVDSVDGFVGADQVLAVGVLRPQPVQTAGLIAVVACPLEAEVAEAAVGAAGDERFLSLAAAQVALAGAVAAFPLPELQWFPRTRAVV